jgi:hypothetical protein
MFPAWEQSVPIRGKKENGRKSFGYLPKWGIVVRIWLVYLYADDFADGNILVGI